MAQRHALTLHSLDPHDANIMTQILEIHAAEPSELHHRVSKALARNPYLNRRRVRAEASNGCVRLEGVVTSYYQKQMAQEMLRSVEGIDAIDNRIEVTWL